MISFNNNWDDILKDEFDKQYYLELREFLIKEYKSHLIYPDKYKIFEALKLTDYEDVKIVILGQDPYHGPNQAHGLAFSVSLGVPIPPSLLNIYKELERDINFRIPNHGYLVDWSKQGVLLLNTALTVRAGMANSHRGKGWEVFTDQVIRLLSLREKPMVFLLWGKNAAEKEALIDTSKHLVLKAPHPSPLSAHRGFLGCGHFSKANEFLIKNSIAPINWQL
ncbi:Uracil-DNA glycosylase [Acetoanaerobium noterae]|uniref:Uracil-DNA glycosylase n=1 Tax=Acetoanaerobium noterae TaxID=745369 RepID=A0A1T5C536_9FIRM|nr:uracil-DNA glycosylase [Acetoanaerobium noterae]MBP8762782.1 uracil-DNA glycosylase [Acetoanaerobium sp.]MBP9499415.1 uracil-DNA glycosylase [Acetoanaerobium sp.]MBP9561775.1 uracil-DNA glycosylase [Acetoanaerobium sp.]SKB54534.1 Uracil-DNA glycosylase [Acetoanaerobium noterae]